MIGDRYITVQSPDKLHMFMDACFGRKQLLILRVINNKQTITKALREYGSEKGLEVSSMDSSNLTVDGIKGESEIIYEEGRPYSQRNKPNYISDNRQLIIVNYLDGNADIEVLRAFCYMGFLGSNYDDITNLSKDKLPYGSAYVFIAGDGFPFEIFASISAYWSDESEILDLRDFQVRAVEHLGRYKNKILNLEEKGTFRYKNSVRFYDHILQQDRKELNVLDKYRNDFFSSDYLNSIKLHRYFHHLNSSQAMCLNFFYPLIKEKQLDPIVNILGLQGKPDYDYVCFEKESDLEQSSERKTNFDFFIKLTSGQQIYFEIKYTERVFGKAKKDNEHINKYRGTYETLATNNPAIVEKSKDIDFFLENYQIMRNLIHIDEDSYVVFIYPEENKRIREAALAAKVDIIEKGWRNHFILFTWEGIIEQLKLHLNSGPLIDYYDKEFSSKYLDF